MEQDYAPGTLKYVREDGEEVIASPHDLMYSTVSMSATHVWNEEARNWRSIFGEDEAEETEQEPTPLQLALKGLYKIQARLGSVLPEDSKSDLRNTITLLDAILNHESMCSVSGVDAEAAVDVLNRVWNSIEGATAVETAGALDTLRRYASQGQLLEMLFTQKMPSTDLQSLHQRYAGPLHAEPPLDPNAFSHARAHLGTTSDDEDRVLYQALLRYQYVTRTGKPYEYTKTYQVTSPSGAGEEQDEDDEE